ncbi:MAG: hypothetical protein U0531_21395 [Dehalococcoidia bacterium]
MTTHSQTEMRHDAGHAAGESAKRIADQTRNAWQQAKEEPTPKGIMGAFEQLPSSAYMYGTLGSIAASALLMLMGKQRWATFIGLWPPTVLALAMMAKQLRPSEDM